MKTLCVYTTNLKTHPINKIKCFEKKCKATSYIISTTRKICLCGFKHFKKEKFIKRN